MTSRRVAIGTSGRSSGTLRDTPPAPGPKSRWWVFAVVSVALFMASIDGTIVATALSTLHHSLHTSINWAGWAITAYQLGQIVAMPVAGHLSDQYGRKRVFISAIVLFTAASLLCGLSTNVAMLIPLRVLQAVGGGAFLPSATGIVSDRFGADRDRAIGMFTSILPAGGLIGPVLGGVFINYWSWRGIFLVNVPIGIILLIGALRLIPPTSGSARGDRTDLIGVAQLGITILGAMDAITNLGNGHARIWSPSFVVPLLVALATGVAFVRRSARVTNPIVPLRLVSGPGFLVMNIINFVFGACAFGIGSLIPLYAQDRFHIPVLESGTLLTARAIGMISLGALTSFVLRRTGYRLPMAVGTTLIGGGLVMIGLTPVGLSPFWWLAAGGAATGLGVGIAAPATNNASLALAPENVAAIAGLRGMFRQSGAILAISIATALLARTATPAVTLSRIFIVLAIVSACTLPLMLVVPERRGSW